MTSLLPQLTKKFFSDNCCNLIIWATGISILVALSVYDFLPLLADYRDNNVATNIAVIKNGTVEQPNVTACLPYHMGALSKVAIWSLNNRTNENMTHCEECEALRNHSPDIWAEMNSVDVANITRMKHKTHVRHTMYENMVASVIMEKVLRETNVSAVLSLNASNFNWNQPIIDAVWIFFSCMHRLDLLFMTAEVDSFNCRSFNFTVTDQLSNRIVDELFDRVLDAVGLYLKAEASVDEFVIERSDLKDRDPPVLIGDKFCFSLFPNSTSEYFEYIAFPEKAQPPWKRYPRTGEFEIYEDPKILYAVVHSYESLYQTDKSLTSDLNYEKVVLVYDVETRVVEARPNRTCSHEPNPSICFMRRQIRDVIRHCKCVPFSFRDLLSDAKRLPYCSERQYLGCSEALKRNIDGHRTECGDMCVYVFYKWKPFFRTLVLESARNLTFVIGFHSAYTPFVEFRLQIKDSPEKFLSQIGGLINLYLGVSGLTLCSFLIFCVDRVKKWHLRRKTFKPASLEQRMTSTAGAFHQVANNFEPNKYGADFGALQATKDINQIRDIIRKELKKELAALIDENLVKK